MSIQHSEACQNVLAEYQNRLSEWLARWPDYCRVCDGEGGTWEPPTDPEESAWIEPCEACTQKGLCARCGKPGLGDEEDVYPGDDPCKFCGWNYNDRLPIEPESPCECQMADNIAEFEGGLRWSLN